MRAVVARVRRASVRVDGEIVGQITVPGLLVLLGIHRDDVASGSAAIDTASIDTASSITAGIRPAGIDTVKVEAMARKLHELRLLREERSCSETGAPLLVVSQFTLYGDTRKGRRPSWSAAAPPGDAAPIVDAVVETLRMRGATVQTGSFGAMMEVESINDGPFTVLVEV
ncbi:MAG TPA: D-aminoacyl-tRNA deacylase [Pseudonocardia sp.]|jgi:D-tyrosyl-tRNA(Tyr) deacylase